MADNENPSAHKAGLFDIRMIIAALIGIYGVILVLTGLFGGDAKVENADPINLWCGVGLVVVAAGFAAWARLRPIVVADRVDSADSADSTDRPPTH